MDSEQKTACIIIGSICMVLVVVILSVLINNLRSAPIQLLTDEIIDIKRAIELINQKLKPIVSFSQEK